MPNRASKKYFLAADALLKVVLKRQVTPYLPLILPFLKHKNREVRRAAVAAIASSKGDLHAKAILPLLEDPDAEVRDKAWMALSQMDLSEVEDKIAGRLNHPKREQRLHAIDVLIGSQKYLPKVLSLLRDAHPIIREHTALALGIYEGPQDIAPSLLSPFKGS